MAEQHAVLGPSGAERWLNCPASIRMAAEIPPQPSSSYAEEGTCAHDRGEIDASFALGKITATEHARRLNVWRKNWQKRIGLTDDQEAEIAGHVQAYVDLILARAAVHPNTQVMLEQRLPTGVPASWGTSDVVLVSPTHTEIIDLKYGMGLRVFAKKNPQLRLYGVGALEAFGDLIGETEDVYLTVFQPRLDHVDTEIISAGDLRAWRDSIIPIAELALTDHAPFGPSEDACRWCPASGMCRAQLEWATRRDFGDPDVLTPEELAEALTQVDAISSWCDAVKSVALDWAYNQGKPIPGHKVVRSRGRRYVTDEDAAINALAMVGHSLDEISTRKIKGITALEKMLGKEEFFDVLGPYVEKREGGPALVSEDDPRPPLNHNHEAMKEFGES